MTKNPSNRFAENLKNYRKARNLTQGELAKLLDFSRSTLADYENGKSEPSLERLEILANYFDLSIDVLIGKEYQEDNLKILTISVDKDGEENIEFVPVTARAGYINGYSDPEYVQTLPRFQIPGLRLGTYRAFEIDGYSMPPIENGFIVIGRYVENLDELNEGGRYVLILRDEGVVFKRVFHSDKPDEFKLVSDNKEYSPYSVKKRNIREIWDFQAFIGYPNYVDNLPIQNLEKKVDEIYRHIKKN